MSAFTFLREDVDVRDYGGHPYCTLNVRIICSIPRCSGSYHLSFSPQGVPARRVFRGPLTEELFGHISPEASVIAAHPIRDERPILCVSVGDVIVVESYGTFEVLKPTMIDYDRPAVNAVPWPVLV